MFGFGGIGKRKETVGLLALSLADGISGMHVVEKATILVLANTMLRTADAIAGVSLAANPLAAGEAVVDRALRDLIAHRNRLAAIVRDKTAPNRRHAYCHLRSAELACLTIGVALDPAAKPGCIAAWKSAWDGRPRMRDAIVWIRRYEGGAGVPAVPMPEGEEATDIDLARIGSSVPAFLKAKRK